MDPNKRKLYAIMNDSNPNEKVELVHIRLEDRKMAESLRLNPDNLGCTLQRLLTKKDNLTRKISEFESQKLGPGAHWYVASPDIINLRLNEKIEPLATKLWEINEVVEELNNGTYQIQTYEI